MYLSQNGEAVAWGSSFGVVVCVAKVGGILVQTPSDNAGHNITDKLPPCAGAAVPVCPVQGRSRRERRKDQTKVPKVLFPKPNGHFAQVQKAANGSSERG